MALSTVKGDVLLPVVVKPQARENAVTGVHNGAVRVHVTAPPAEGAANAAVLKVLAGALRIPKSSLSIERGGKSREKLVRIAGLIVEDVRAKLAALPEP